MRTGRLFRMGFSWAAAALLLAFAAPAWAGTFTVTGAAGQSVTMNDEIDTLTFTVTNTDNNDPINRVTFAFPSSLYYIEWGTQAPAGWTINNITGVTSSIQFDASTNADRIAPGASLAFSIQVKGPGWTNFVRSASDQTDTLSSVTVRGATEVFTLSGSLPTWPRRSLAVTLVATPDAVGVGQTITLTMQVENRSTASKASITASPNPPTINLGGGAAVTQTGGPTYSPSPLTLNAAAQGTITYTYRADAAGTVSWSAGATAASATSKTGTSNTVVINPLAASLSVDPLCVTSGQNVTVKMQVQSTGAVTTLTSGISSTDTTIPVASTTSFSGSGTLLIDSEELAYAGTTGTSFTGVTRGVNGTTTAAHSNGAVVRSTTALGNLVPTLSSSGTATATLVSGPTPATLASLAPGQTGVFQWVYTITGTIGRTYQFQGSVTADGTYTSNTAQSQQGTVCKYSVVASPTTIASCSTNVPISFTVYNGDPSGGDNRLRQIYLWFPNSTWDGYYQSSSVSGCAGWAITKVGGGVRFRTTGAGAIAYQQNCTFNVTFSQVPAVTVDTTYAFYMDMYDVNLQYLATQASIPVTVTAYCLALTHNPGGPFPADGTCSTTLTATLSGASPLSGRVIAFTTTAGTLSSGTATTNASGAATVTLRAPVSSTAVTASLTATYIKTKGTDSVSYNAYCSGANLQYVGGSLSPMAVPMSCSKPFSVRVRNLGTSSATLTTATTFTFTGYSANLSAGATIAAGVEAALTFNSVTTPATAGSYAPTLTFDVAGCDCNNNPTATQTRSVSDNVTVAGPCSTTVRILDWREVVK
ncbi:MAG: Ig-like domain-containing protein [Nitrospirae bacterium]|nr:Ig-like domain-containing protein [Nitrospirota bacterium]